MIQRITQYTFIPGTKQILFPSLMNFSLDGILLITNVTSGVGITIFDFGDATLGGTLSGNTLTLAYNTASMNPTDSLQILYDDGIAKPVDPNTELLTAIYNALYAQNLILRAMALDQGCDLPDELEELIEEVI